MSVYPIDLAQSNVAGADAHEQVTAMYAAGQELELYGMGSILADPLPGLDLADRCGLDARHFDEPDLQIVYLACVALRQLGRLSGSRCDDKLAVLKLARKALREQGFWEETDTRPFPSGSRWSDSKLAALASMFPGVAMVKRYARELIALRDRLDHAGRLVAELRDVLNPEDVGIQTSSIEGLIKPSIKAAGREAA